jgi:glutamate carboxypeptidase
LLVIGHMDTVLPAALPRREGDRLYATGAIDMKGGLAAFLGALDLARQRGSRVPDDILLAVVPDEEVSGEIAHAVTAELGMAARGVWVIEPGEAAGDGETVVAGRRGMFDWRVDVRGVAANSGLHYWRGRSAVEAAARWSASASAISRRDEGPTVNVARLVGGERGFVEDLGGSYGLLGSHRQLNVVPDRALIDGEARFLRPAEGEEIAGRLERLAAEVAEATGCEVSVRRGETVPPVDARGPYSGWTLRAVELAAVRGWRLEVETTRGGISFPNFLPDPTRFPILDGLGPVGGGMHTREEFISIRSLERRVGWLADLLASDIAQ